MELQEHFQQIPDFRRGQGLRYPLDSVLTIILFATMSGYTKYREIAHFAKRHASTFMESLPLKHGVPSHVTIREIIMRVDFVEVQRQFNLWAGSLLDSSSDDSLSGDSEITLINIDGKSIRSTLEDYSSSYQNFVCFAHAYAAKRGIVLQAMSYDNKETSEIPFVQALIKALNVKNSLLSLDALHAQKKQSQR